MSKKKLNSANSTGFKTPDTYFGSIEHTVFSKLENNKSSISKCTGFNVPDAYFDTVESEILKLVIDKETTKVFHVFSWKNAAYISGIAASLLLVFNVNFTNSDTINFETLETASIESYLMNEDLNAYDLAPYLNVNALNTDDFVDNTLKPSDIEDYLLQNSDLENLFRDQ